ncbi:MAG: arabinose isomerase, partial [Verrucomicrobia bacterium]|nr:arabinose isomerase [Verrucomicrobiota bacterium]
MSSTVLPVVQRAKVPIIILNLQPTAAIDYQSFNRLGNRTKMTGEWLAYCAACPVPEIANAFNRARIGFHQVTGTLEESSKAWTEIDEWIEAAKVAHAMSHNRLGLMGHYYNGMLDIYTDTTRQISYFGGHIEIIEVEELAALRRDASRAEIDAKLEEFKRTFDIQPDCPQDEL